MLYKKYRSVGVTIATTILAIVVFASTYSSHAAPYPTQAPLAVICTQVTGRFDATGNTFAGIVSCFAPGKINYSKAAEYTALAGVGVALAVRSQEPVGRYLGMADTAGSLAIGLNDSYQESISKTMDAVEACKVLYPNTSSAETLNGTLICNS